MRFTIIRDRTMPSEDINAELQWIGHTLGLFNERDKEKSCFRIFIELLRSTNCLLYTSPSPRDRTRSRMPSSA